MKQGVSIWLIGENHLLKTRLAEVIVGFLQSRGLSVELIREEEARAKLLAGLEGVPQDGAESSLEACTGGLLEGKGSALREKLEHSLESQPSHLPGLAWCCGLLARHGVITVVDAFVPSSSLREDIRFEIGDYVEVYSNINSIKSNGYNANAVDQSEQEIVKETPYQHYRIGAGNLVDQSEQEIVKETLLEAEETLEPSSALEKSILGRRGAPPSISPRAPRHARPQTTFELPNSPELTLNFGGEGLEEAAARVIRLLEELQYIQEETSSKETFKQEKVRKRLEDLGYI